MSGKSMMPPPPKFNLSSSVIELKKRCDRFQSDSDICLEIVNAMQKDLENPKFNNVQEAYNRFLTEYTNYLKIKAKIETFIKVEKDPINKCPFFDYSFLDDVRAHEVNLMDNVKNVNEIVAMFERYNNPISDKDMRLHNIYEKYLYQDLFSSIAPYYDLLITQTLNYKKMRGELIQNLNKILDNLNEDIKIIQKIDEKEISSEELRVLERLNKLLHIPKNLDNISSNTPLTDKEQAIVNSAKNDILKIYNNFCNIEILNLITDNFKYNVDYKTLAGEYNAKKCEVNSKYIKYLKSNVPKSSKIISVARQSIRRTNATRTKTVKNSIGKSIAIKTRKGSMPPKLIELSEAEKIQKTLEEADKINREVEDLLASLSEEFKINVD